MDMPASRIAEPDQRLIAAPEQRSIDEFATGGSGAKGAIRFRHYNVEPSTRLLLRDGRPVYLGSRAFDLLLVLLRSRGVLVSKEAIVRHVWPETLVDESNLRFQMASLRNALGEDRDVIKTIPGRGYLFADEGDMTETAPRVQAETSLSVARDSITRWPRANIASHTDDMVRKASIVIIDDDCESREALEGLLQSVGLQVESFGSVQAYLDRVRLSPPRCLVLDVWLPGRSGLDFQAELVRSGVHVPIIFISGHADLHMGVQAMKAGAFEFLAKPVRHQELLEAIWLAIAP
ncbi:response regulator [Mesorhizobium sp. dw_380]|uniref:response regulator n=1 Tax=Mesorhizobium sp. dw_380 TaxID=2812001 RepID=UPI001BDEB984|nr:response regulator [Mesorhizobium sp. dw_380]